MGYITEMMEYCNNHFLCTVETPQLTFKDTASVYTIEGVLGEEYLVGQYIYIYGSKLNDQAYKIKAVATNKLTVEESVLNETSDDVVIFGCAVPKSFITLESDISNWDSKNGGLEGITAERIDDYSISFGGTSGGGSGVDGWQGAFSSRLNNYRRIYDDIESYLNGAYYGYR